MFSCCFTLKGTFVGGLIAPLQRGTTCRIATCCIATCCIVTCFIAIPFVAITLFASPVLAQTLTFNGGAGEGTYTVTLDTTEGVRGFSYGLCEQTQETINIVEVSQGSALAATNGGAGPQFFTAEISPFGGGQGDHLVSTTVSFTPELALPAGNDLELTLVTVACLGSGSSTDLCFCDTLGSPFQPTLTEILVASAFVTPATICGNVQCTGTANPYRFIASAPNAIVADVQSTGAILSFDLSIAAASPLSPPTQGFNFQVDASNQGGDVIAINSVELQGPLLALNGGSGPDFFSSDVAFSTLTVDVVYGGLGFAGAPTTLGFSGSGEKVVKATGDLIIDNSNEPDCDIENARCVKIKWVPHGGSGLALGFGPTAANSVIVDGLSAPALLVDGQVSVVPGVPFVRGDCNSDSTVDIGDGVHIISRLFGGQEALGDCELACDINNDTMFDSSDFIYLLNYFFLLGPPIPAPFPMCSAMNGIGPETGCATETGGCQ